MLPIDDPDVACGRPHVALEEGDRILLSDNGEMLAHLEAVGVPVGRRVATLRDQVACFGLTLGDQGDARVLVPAEQGAHMLATAISGLRSVAEGEREQVGLDDGRRVHRRDSGEL